MGYREIAIGFLHQCLSYDKETGSLCWRHRPISHFGSDRQTRRWNTRYAGKIAGSVFCSETKGYRVVLINKRGYQAARIIVALMTESWPTAEVDHINGVRDDNRWNNLRLATDGENSQNRKLRRDNKSGYMGVSWNIGVNKWIANITTYGIRRTLGCFNDPSEAHSAYLEAKKTSHLFQPVPREGSRVV